tara:strand:- start:210 stop:470 length:261 start_codon:yes stop_codon:yes gene_type:complete
MAFKMKGPSAFKKDGKGKYKVKKFVKGLFGKEYIEPDLLYSPYGDDTQVTISNKRTKVKGSKGKEILTGEDKKAVDTMYTKKKGSY